MIPPEAAMGGPETMYPEYRQKIKTMVRSTNSQAVVSK
jgi:hypothetical protein